MTVLDYNDMISKVEKSIASQHDIVLATCDKNKVTARTVYCISYRLKVYFLTSKAYLKYKQIEKNPNVALCFDNVQIEGVANILGHPSEPNNTEIMEKAKEHNGFMQFVKYKNTVLIEISISNVEMWLDHKRVFIDINKKECYTK